MGIFSRATSYGSIALVMLLITVSRWPSSSKDPPAQLAARPATEPATQPSLSDCLAESDSFDPGGNGGDQLGFGFMNGSTFIRVDRFDIKQITTAAGTPISDVEIQSHALRGINSETGAEFGSRDWEGVVLVGQLHCTNPKLKGKTHDIKARIVDPPRPGELGALERSLWTTFKLELELGDGKRFESACSDPDDVAFPIAGYWNESGDYIRDPHGFSFACTRHGAAECIQKGYLDDSKSADTASLFEACIRMMRADYCGDGVSHTEDGTFVIMYDNRNIVAREALEPLEFEAAWSSKGLVCGARTRWGDAKIPSCFQTSPMPLCSAEDALQHSPEEPLLFNDSCVSHPCEVIKREPSPGVGARRPAR